MNKRKPILHGFVLLLLCCGTACERNIDIGIKTNTPFLVVEGYINNEMPSFNYVVLSKSLDYYSPDFQNTPVTGAVVTITEGDLLPDNTYQWDNTTKTQLTETSFRRILGGGFSGVYSDSRVVTDSIHALIGTPGKHYLLEIETEGNHYSAVTFLPPPLPIDSLTSGFHFIDDDDSSKTRARLTVHYQDPDTIGNTQLFYWRRNDSRLNAGWGGLGSSRSSIGADDLTNGEYMHLTIPNGFDVGDTVNFFMVSVERKIYNFWDSYRKARNNDGPFATPVTFLSTINGENVTGSFSGFGVSSKTIIVK